MFTIRTSGDGPTPRTLFLAGEMDMAFSGHVRAAVESTLAATASQWVIVDLRDTTLIDSSAVKELVDAHRLAARQGRVLILRNATGIVAEVLRVAGVAATLSRPATTPTGTIYGSSARGRHS
ncbi:STAS domain-containing protein [Micromonospora sp. NPDC049799]|uniref:STAS domain-containing protein n=1 Tax=Micromonospora sp. NPDC049799 TaxID=3154741 RepID=UPI0033E924B9